MPPGNGLGRLGKVAVVGGGIGGLAAAYRLGALGAEVSLFEASDQLGGLGTFFPYRSVHLERFYHCMLPSDRYLLSLLAELGLDAEVYWKETSFGFMTRGELYPLNSPLELLRFEPLPFISRLRVGATGLWGRLRSAQGLDEVTCVDWLTRLSGRKAFEVFWRPMLQAKFGERYHQVPALWFWTRFNREKGSGPERKGYIRGGYKRIVDVLAQRLGELGVQLHVKAAVERLDLDEQDRVTLTAGGSTRSFDRVVITAPAFFLHQATAGGRLSSIAARANAAIDSQGVINAAFMLRRPLTRHYWLAAIDDDVPFQGVVESTTLLDFADTGGVHLVYVMNYLHRSEPAFSRPDDVILDEYQDGLRRLFPDLRSDEVVDRFLFRSPFVEPLYTTGYLRRQPPAVLWPARVYLANTTQVYPDVTSWNGAVGSIDRLMQRIRADQRDPAETSTQSSTIAAKRRLRSA